MSTDPIRVSRREFSSEEILNRLDTGRRVIVTVEVMGVTKDVSLRKSDDTYVCDTGFKLLSYEERGEMKRCIERLRLTDD